MKLYYSFYTSPVGILTIVCDDNSVRSILLESQDSPAFEKLIYTDDSPVIRKVNKWLNAYFAGARPNVTEIPLYPGGTDFQNKIWNILLNIPYGKTYTYGQIADIYIKQNNISKMSAQAVGQAIAKNPIAIIIPCHRVIGKNGTLTGYAGGLEAKRKLLQLEGAAM